MFSKKEPLTTDEIVKAVKALNASNEVTGPQKYIPHMIVTVILGLLFWFGATVLNLSTAVTTLSVNVNTMSKTMADLQTGAGQSQKTVGDLQAATAREDARADAIEADVGRVKERVRILEGLKPVSENDAAAPHAAR